MFWQSATSWQEASGIDDVYLQVARVTRKQVEIVHTSNEHKVATTYTQSHRIQYSISSPGSAIPQ